MCKQNSSRSARQLLEKQSDKGIFVCIMDKEDSIYRNSALKKFICVLKV